MPINIERPRSALLRGVQITEFKGHILNPDPIILQETDLLLEEFLSPTKLVRFGFNRIGIKKALTGVNDLSSVEHLEMIVDTSETSLGNFGIYLPNLKHLKLNGSHVPRIRDLGTSLANLRVLWLSRSGLTDLDGIPTLNSLQEIYLAYNEITDLSPCSLLENLKCLDLEGNLIDDIKQVEFLNLCPSLKNLTLYGNPICAKPTPESNDNDKNYSYRHEVIKILPALEILDDELTLNTKSKSLLKSKLLDKSSNDDHQQCPFDDDWQLINQFIEEGIGPPEEKLAINESLRPGTASSHNSRTSTSVRPLTAMRPLSSYRIKTALNPRPNSRQTSNSSGLNTAASRLSTANSIGRPSSDPVGDISNDASHLTVGPALQGNLLRSLLARKKTRPSTPSSDLSKSDIIANKILPSKNITVEPSTDDVTNSPKNTELHDEIVKWKKEHAKKLEERKKYFEPQVLRIDDDYEPPLTDNEFVDEDLDEYNNVKKVEVVMESNYTLPLSSSSSNRLKSSRPKSAFKQNFDYHNEINEKETRKHMEVNENQTNEESKAENKERKKKDRSKSKDKHRRRSSSRSRNNDQESIDGEVVRERRRDSASSSRIATGDTGYESALSSLSLSSFASSSSNNHYKTAAEILNNLKDRHQPIIVSSSSSSSSAAANLNSTNNFMQSSLSSSMKTISQQNLGGLKQLKTNLAPLTGIVKFPK